MCPEAHLTSSFTLLTLATVTSIPNSLHDPFSVVIVEFLQNMSGYYSNYSRTVHVPRKKKVSPPQQQQQQQQQRPVPVPTKTDSAQPAQHRPTAAANPTTKTTSTQSKLKRRQQKRKQRPSLSEQLASIGSNADKITNGLRERHGLKLAASILFTTPAQLFVVGRLESRAPSPVEFHQNHCAYSFQHPYQTKTRIDMKMQYVHMRNARVRQDRISGNFFEFRIESSLKHYGIDYDPGKREHVIKIKLASGTDATRILKDIVPKTKRRR